MPDLGPGQREAMEQERREWRRFGKAAIRDPFEAGFRAALAVRAEPETDERPPTVTAALADAEWDESRLRDAAQELVRAFEADPWDKSKPKFIPTFDALRRVLEDGANE